MREELSELIRFESADVRLSGVDVSGVVIAPDGSKADVLVSLPGDKLTPAEGPATLCGAFIETSDATGLAIRIEPVRLGGRLAQAMPKL